MFELIFGLLMLYVFGKMFFVGIRAAWGITKFIVCVILLPLTLLFLAIEGFVLIAIPILIIIAVLSMFN